MFAPANPTGASTNPRPDATAPRPPTTPLAPSTEPLRNKPSNYDPQANANPAMAAVYTNMAPVHNACATTINPALAVPSTNPCYIATDPSCLTNLVPVPTKTAENLCRHTNLAPDSTQAKWHATSHHFNSAANNQRQPNHILHSLTKTVQRNPGPHTHSPHIFTTAPRPTVRPTNSHSAHATTYRTSLRLTAANHRNPPKIPTNISANPSRRNRQALLLILRRKGIVCTGGRHARPP